MVDFEIYFIMCKFLKNSHSDVIWVSRDISLKAWFSKS